MSKIYFPPRVVQDTTVFQHMSSLISTLVHGQTSLARLFLSSYRRYTGNFWDSWGPGTRQSWEWAVTLLSPKPCSQRNLKSDWAKRPSLSCLGKLWNTLTGCVIKSSVPRGGSQHLLMHCLTTPSACCWRHHLTGELAFEVILSHCIRFKYQSGGGGRDSWWRPFLSHELPEHQRPHHTTEHWGEAHLEVANVLFQCFTYTCYPAEPVQENHAPCSRDFITDLLPQFNKLQWSQINIHLW